MRTKKTDDNQAEIVQSLRKIGASVQDLSGVGGGCPDLLVGFRGVNYLMEIKRNTERGVVKPSESKLNARQVEWHGVWNGQVCVVRTPEEAINLIMNGH